MEYNDITETGYNNWSDLQDLNEEYQGIQDYLDTNPPRRKKSGMTEKQRLSLIDRLQKIKEDQLLLQYGIRPYSKPEHVGRYNPEYVNFEDLPYMSPMALTDTPFGSSRYDDNVQSLYQLEHLQDVRAENQSGFNKLMSGTAKAAVLAGTTWIDGTVGLLYGATAAGVQWALDTAKGDLSWDNFSNGLSKLFNNEISNGTQLINQYMEKALPNYSSELENSRAWYQNMGTANFWADFIKQIGFTVGAYYSGASWTKALKAANLVKSAMGARVVGSTLSAVNEARIEANNNSNDWKKLELEKFDYEFQKEKDMVMRDYYNGMLSDYEANSKLEQLYQNKELYEQAIEDRANKVGIVDMAINIPILAVNDYFMYGKAYSRGFNNANKNQLGKRTFKDIMKSAGEELGIMENDLAQNTAKQAGRYTWNPIKTGKAAAKGGLGFLREGHEEVAQAFAAEFAKNYYTPDSPDAYLDALYDPDSILNTKDFYRSLTEGFASTYGNIDTYQEFFMGGLNGLLGTPTFGRSLNRSSLTYLGKGKPVGLTGGLFGNIREARVLNQQGLEAVDFMNSYLDKYDLSLSEGLRHFAASDHFTDLMNGWAEESNAFEYKNAQDNDDYEAIVRFNSVGKLDDFKQLVNQDFENMSDVELDKIAKFTTSNEQWKNPDGTYMSESEEGRAKMRQILTLNKEKLLAEVDSFEKAYETMTNITNDDLDQDKILELSWLKWKLDRFDTRFKSIKTENQDFFNSMRDGANSYVNFVESVGDQKELQPLKRVGENIIDLIDYINDSKTTLEFARKLGQNYNVIEALLDDKVYNLFAQRVGMSSDEYKNTVLNLIDVGKMGKLAEQFDSRLKEYLEKPSKMLEAREKVEKKFDDRQKKKKAESAAQAIVDADISDVARNIEEYEFLELDGNIFTQDGVNITGNLDDETKAKVQDKVNQAKLVKQTKDMMVDIINKDDLGFLDYEMDASDKDAVLQTILLNFLEGDIDMFDLDYNGDLSEYSFINEGETGTVAELQDKDRKRREYVMSILSKTLKQKTSSEKQKQNTPQTDTEKESNALKQEKPDTTGRDSVDKVNPVKSKQPNPLTKKQAELNVSSALVEESTIDSQKSEYNDNIDVVTDENSQWTSGVSMLPLSRFRKDNDISDFDYTSLFKIVQEDPEGRYFTGQNETAYVENVGEFLYTNNAYENRHKGFAKVGSKVTFAISKTLNDKVTQPVILIMDESGLNVLGNLPLLNAKGNSRQLNDFINYCIERIDNDITDDLQILKDTSGNNIQSEIDQNYTGRIPFVQERNSVYDVFQLGVRFAISKEDGENVGVYTSKTDFPNPNVRPPKRALKGQPFVLIKSSNGMEVTVPFFMRRFNAESSRINGNPTFFDQEVRKTVESIANRNNQKKMDTLISLSAMNKLNSLFSSQDFHVNFDESTGMITDIYVGGKDESSTETTKRYVYNSNDGVLTVDGLMNRIYELNMPINVDLNRINTNAKIGGVGYNTAIALMAEVSLAPNTTHTIDDWFTIRPVVDGKMVQEKSERYASATQTQSVTILVNGGDFIRRDNYDYFNSETGEIFGVDYDTNAFINNRDKSAEQRLITRAKVYVEQRLMQNQDTIIHLNLGQVNPLDYDIKNNKLVIPVLPKQVDIDLIDQPTDLPASQVLQTQQEVKQEIPVLPVPEAPVQATTKIDYESANMEDIENWYEEDCDIDGYNDVWNNSDDETKKKIYTVRDYPNLVDVFIGLSNGNTDILDSLINNTPLTRTVDNTIKSEEQVKEEELDWLKKTYPQLSSQERLKVVDGLIKIAQSDNPGFAWGMFSNGVIYLSDQAANGTVYHEAFHAVSHTLMTNGEFNKMLNIARKLHPNKNQIELEEILAEDFRGYMQLNISDMNDNFIQKMFKQLKNIIKGLFNKQYLLNNLYYRISQGMYSYRQVRYVAENTQYRTATNPTIEKFTESTIKAIKDQINGIGSMRVGSEDVIRLVTGKNQFYNYRTKLMDYFDTPRQFINVGALFNAGYDSNSNYDTTGSDIYYNREQIVNEVRDRISRLGYDNLVYVGRNEYGAYELMPIESAFKQVYDSQYLYQHKPIEGDLTDIKDYFDLSGMTKASDFLDKIIGQDTRIGFLADILKNKITDANNVDVRLVTPDEILKIREQDNLDGMPQGFFRPADNTIYINNETTERPDKLFLHELIHSFAFNSKKSVTSLKRLNSIYNDAVSQLEKKYGVSKEELLKHKKFYGLKNIDEFLSEFFSNGLFMKEIASLENQSEKKISLKDKLMNWILNVLGIKSTSDVFDRAKQFLEEMLMNQYTVSEQQLKDMRDTYQSYQDKYYMSEQYDYDIIQEKHISLMYENLSEDRIKYLNDNEISEELYEKMDDDSKEQLFICMH